MQLKTFGFSRRVSLSLKSCCAGEGDDISALSGKLALCAKFGGLDGSGAVHGSPNADAGGKKGNAALNEYLSV